jgi:hypothetical protein
MDEVCCVQKCINEYIIEYWKCPRIGSNGVLLWCVGVGVGGGSGGGANLYFITAAKLVNNRITTSD